MLLRGHHDDAEVLFQRIREDLSSILNNLEGRFLYLIKEEASGAIPREGVVSELSLLSRDLKSCFRRLVDLQERRDLSFKATKELQEIDQCCVWLFRKIRVQQTFLKKLSLEARLRSLVSPEAFSAYQTLLNLDEEDRDTITADEAKIRLLLLQPEDRSSTPALATE
jgi:hypothetical protein